jgi:hypothetical protein
MSIRFRSGINLVFPTLQLVIERDRNSSESNLVSSSDRLHRWLQCLHPLSDTVEVKQDVRHLSINYEWLISRTKFRVQMNKADNEAGNRAVDSLINFETVKVSQSKRIDTSHH